MPDSLEMKMIRRQIVTAQAHAAHKIGLDHRRPVRIGDGVEGLGFVQTQVIDQNVNLRKLVGG
jgi:hypothetical protein